MKDEEICKEKVCFCVRHAICFEDYECLFIPDDAKEGEIYLDVWDDIDEEDAERVVIVNPIEEFEFGTDKYFRVIKTIGNDIYDFRLVEKKFGIFVYLEKAYYDDYYPKYVFYYKGKRVYSYNCPPTYANVFDVCREIPELNKYWKEYQAIRTFLEAFSRLRYIAY